MSRPSHALSQMIGRRTRDILEDSLLDAQYPPDFVDSVIREGADLPSNESSGTGMELLEIQKVKFVRRSVLPPSGTGMSKRQRRKQGVKLEKIPVGLRFQQLVRKTSGGKERIVKFKGVHNIGDTRSSRVSRAVGNVLERRHQPAMTKLRDQQKKLNPNISVKDNYAVR